MHKEGDHPVMGSKGNVVQSDGSSNVRRELLQRRQLVLVVKTARVVLVVSLVAKAKHRTNNVSGHIISQGMEDNGSDVVNVNGDSNGTIIDTKKKLAAS